MIRLYKTGSSPVLDQRHQPQIFLLQRCCCQLMPWKQRWFKKELCKWLMLLSVWRGREVRQREARADTDPWDKRSCPCPDTGKTSTSFLTFSTAADRQSWPGEPTKGFCVEVSIYTLGWSAVGPSVPHRELLRPRYHRWLHAAQMILAQKV